MNESGTSSGVRSASIVLVAVVHCFLLFALLSLRWSSIHVLPQREMEIHLQPPSAHLRPPLPPARHPLHAKRLESGPFNGITLEGLQGAIHDLSELPTVPFSLPNIANLHPGWHFDAQDERRLLLNEPEPEHKWTWVEVNLYKMRTADPCMVDRTAGLPFCIDQIIHGPYTIPDSAPTKPPGISVMGISIFDGR